MKNIFYILLLLLTSIMMSCSPKDHAADVHGYNIHETFEINGKRAYLYVEDGTGSQRGILPWGSFMQFGRYDLTNIPTGTLKIKTGVSEDGTQIYDDELGFLKDFNYSAILLGWENEDFAGSQITLGNHVANENGINLYDLSKGVPFTINNWSSVTSAVELNFSLWGKYEVDGETQYQLIMKKPVVWLPGMVEQVFKISFIKPAFTGISLQEKKKSYEFDGRDFKPNSGKTDDKWFKRILSDAKSKADGDLTDKSKKWDDNEKKWVDNENNELNYINNSRNNINKYLADLLLEYSLSNWTRKHPNASSELDNYFVLYSNINETVDAMEIFGEDVEDLGWNTAAIYGAYMAVPVVGWCILGYQAYDLYQNYDRLNDYLDALVGKDLMSFSPGEFTNLVLHSSDYLLEAGIACLLDDDFNSRYFNYLDAMVQEHGNLLSLIHDVFHDNNIVIKYYATATLYDCMKGVDRGHYNNFKKYYANMTDSDGEYGEGFGYLNYVFETVLPVLYLGNQEEYQFNVPAGKNRGDKWFENDDPVVQLAVNGAKNMLESADKWGVLPALDDGFYQAPWLAPVAVLADDAKYLDYTQKVEELKRNGAFASDLKGFGSLNATMQLLMYPYEKPFSKNGTFSVSDGVKKSGNVVKIHASDYSNADYDEEISLTLIAEDNPETGSTHDQIDHGAIQLNRYVDSTKNGGGRHVNFMILDPGYPGFNEAKRYEDEWQFRNQNVLMMYNHDIKKVGDKAPHAHVYTGEHNAPYDDAFDPRRYGGMSGYKYMDKEGHANVFQGVIFETEFWSDLAANFSPSYSLERDGGGKSEVVKKYKNGVKTKITYEYRFPTLIPSSNIAAFKLTSNCQAYREVYNLGNSFYVLDQFPPELRSIDNISFATSWNLPKFTKMAEDNSGNNREGCFEGVRPDTSIVIPNTSTKYSPETKIQISVKGFTEEVKILPNKEYGLNHSFKNEKTFKVDQVVYENNMSNTDFMISDITLIDGSEDFRKLDYETYNTTDNVTVWKKVYVNSEEEIVIFNNSTSDYDYSSLNIESNAKVWIIHLNGTTKKARLFGGTTLSTSHSYTKSGEQYDITL